MAERSTLKRVLQAAFSTFIVVGIFVGVLPRIASYGEVWDAIAAMTWPETLGLLAVTLWNLVTYWFVLVAVLPGLTYPKAAIANQASTAIANTLPGGGALGVGVSYAMYSSWGFGTSEIALSVLVSGVFNNFVKLGMPVVALAILAVAGDANAALVSAAAIGVAVLLAAIVLYGLMLYSEQLARAIGSGLGRVVSRVRALFRRPAVETWGEAAARFRRQTIGLLRERWLWITVASMVSHGSLFVVLLVTLRNVGVSPEDVSWPKALAAFAFVRLVSALPITPGGLGVVELGYTAALAVGVSSGTEAGIVAAVLVFRALTYVVPIPLGALSYLYWRRSRSVVAATQNVVDTAR